MVKPKETWPFGGRRRWGRETRRFNQRRSKDAEIARLRRLAYGVEVLDVDARVTRVAEEPRAGAEPPLKRMWLEQAASARVVGALQERLVAVKREQVEERATRHSELRASVDAKVKAAVKEALAQVAHALECACCFQPLAHGAAVALDCGHTYCNQQACASSSVTACPECRMGEGREAERGCSKGGVRVYEAHEVK